MTRRFDLIAFDCDGVLVDTEGLTHQVLVSMLAELGWVLTVEQAMQHFIGRSVPDEIELIAHHIGRPVPDHFYVDFLRRRDAELERSVQPIAGAVATVHALQQAGMPFCVASGADRAKMHITLGRCELLPFFAQRMFSGMELPRSKPAPDVYLQAAATMQVAPSRCLVIEDTPTGVAAGIAAGMTVWGYAGYVSANRLLDAGADLVFADMASVPRRVLT